MAKGKDRIYGIHNGMKNRCYNPNCKDFPRYGGSGITICDEWKNEGGAQNFYNWAIANGYDDKLTIDRIDGTSGYSPKNCRWATISEQNRNRKSCRYLEYNGEIKTLKEWADIAGIRKDTFRRRLMYGWSMEEAMTIPKLENRWERLHHRTR